MSPLWLLAGPPLWTIGWFAWYFLFDAKHDSSGDGGLAVMFIALIWLFGPYILIHETLHRLFGKKP